MTAPNHGGARPGAGRPMSPARRLREAAPLMLQALKALSQGFQDGSIAFTAQRQTDADPYHPANVLLCAAILAATGPEEETR